MTRLRVVRYENGMTRDPVLTSGSVLVALGLALGYAAVRVIRRPTEFARGFIAWRCRRWLREDDVPPWAMDVAHATWGAGVFGRWLAFFALLVLALGGRLVLAAL